MFSSAFPGSFLSFSLSLRLVQKSPVRSKLLPAKRLQVVLPPPKVVHIVIDDKATKVWDRSITWWTPWVPYNPDLERQARLAAKDVVERTAIEMGILDQARRNAEAAIRGMLETFGLRSVTVESASGKT
jgi:Protein of unknown function (DUF4230)